MSGSYRKFAAALVAFGALLGGASTQSKSLRVCGDPDNLPYSNTRLEGYENKIAAVVASELGATPTYAWWPHQRGLVRNTIDADACDVIFGIPEGLDRVLWTKPYYRSSYVLAYRKGASYRITSLDSPDIKRLRIGVYSNTPVEESLARRGLLDNVATYSLFFDPRGDRDRPGKLLEDLIAGVIDVALPWGPLAGYYTKRLSAPLELIPLHDEPGVPLAFNVSMGVKKGNQALKGQLEAAIDKRRSEIQTILEDFGIPLMAAHEASFSGTPAQNQDQERKAPDSSAEPAQNPPAPPRNRSAGTASGRRGRSNVVVQEAEPVHGQRRDDCSRPEALLSGRLSGVPRRWRRRRNGDVAHRRSLEVRQRR